MPNMMVKGEGDGGGGTKDGGRGKVVVSGFAVDMVFFGIAALSWRVFEYGGGSENGSAGLLVEFGGSAAWFRIAGALACTAVAASQ